ncbi:MAG: NAD-dependent epimerase/dehydratase family protein [Kiritimatiellaeota bacterium]|nr:NAD-dependent epimerase/dehydratase family protein [Kiritimatiellota bacterium]
MKTVLVTGASGFVGGHVVAALARSGYQPRCLVRVASRTAFIRAFSPELVLGDVTDPASLAVAVAGVEGIIHCAGLTRAVRPEDLQSVNVDGTRNLLEACVQVNPTIRRIIHISSLAALGPSSPGQAVREGQERRPVSDYGRSKLDGQLVAESFRDKLPVTMLVPPAVYGPLDKDFLIYFRLLKRRLLPLLGGGVQTVSLIYAKDLALAALACLESGYAAGREYLVDDGQPRTWQEIAATIGGIMQIKPVVLRLPLGAMRALAACAEFAARCTGRPTLLSRDKLNEFVQPAWVCSAARIHEELGFKPEYTLEQGLEETWQWYRKQHWL